MRKVLFILRHFCLILMKQMRTLELVTFVACFWQVVFCERVQYDNYRLYSVNIANVEQLNVLRELQIHSDGSIFQTIPTGVGQIVDLIVAPHKLADISELFERFEFKYRLKSENLQKYD